MLLDFSLANFRSFDESQSLSLVASRERSAERNLIRWSDHSLLRSAALYGHNASGKSNLIRAISFMERFVRNSATSMNIGDRIRGAVPYRLREDSAAAPSEFEARIVVEGVRYDYGFSADWERIHGEWLIAYPRGRPQRWLERKWNPETEKTHWKMRGPLLSAQKILSDRTRANGLALSRGADLNIESLHPVYLWFTRKLRVLDLSLRPVALLDDTCRQCIREEGFLSRALDFLRDADMGIDDLRIEEPSGELGLPTEVTSSPLRGNGQTFSTQQKWTIHAAHRVSDGEGMIEFDFHQDESNGTQRLFALAGPILSALAEGAVVVVDELECSLHTLLVRKLIELFHSAETNPHGAQLIFATHDSQLMDPSLFRRDQIWLVEKLNGASELYSLYDYKEKPRHREAFRRRYLAGRYGAVPFFGPMLEGMDP